MKYLKFKRKQNNKNKKKLKRIDCGHSMLFVCFLINGKKKKLIKV